MKKGRKCFWKRSKTQSHEHLCLYVSFSFSFLFLFKSFNFFKSVKDTENLKMKQIIIQIGNKGSANHNV